METNAAVLAAPMPRCGVCGHLLQQDNCNRCGGRAEDLRGDPVRPGRSFAVFGVVDGIVTMFRAALQVTLMPAFVGRLWVPVFANAVVVLGCGLAAWLLLIPGYHALLSSRWFALDGLSTSDVDHGAIKLTLVTVWLLVPVLLAITAGVLMEPLHAATEARLCGPGMRVREPRDFADVVVRGMRLPARALALALIALPVLLLIALVPWAGLPLALLGCGAFAGAVLCEPAAARRGLHPREFLRLLLGNWPRVVGLGTGFLLCMLVPLLNVLLLMPAGAVASAALYFRFDKSTPQG